MNNEHHLKSLVELERLISERTAEFNGKRKYNQKWTNFWSLGQLLFSWSTTLIIATNLKFNKFEISLAATIIASLATLSGLVLSKYMYQERMSSNIKTVCSFYELSDDIAMLKKKEIDGDESRKITLEIVDKFHAEYQRILNSANGEWQKNLLKSREARDKK